MKRREFITLFGGATVVWPRAARAQQGERMRRIGVLMNLTAEDAEGQARLAAFLQGLQEAGWAVGRNVRVDIRWGASDVDRIRKHAADLVALAPNVILASTGQVMAVMQQATTHRADCVHGRQRSGRQRLRRQPGAAGRQHHRFQLG